MTNLQVATKLSLSEARAGVIERRQLIRSVIEASAASVILFHAPPGFGKTVVMEQIARRMCAEGIGVGWVSFDESDADISRFLTYLQLALLNALGDECDHDKDDITGDTDTIVARCVNLMLSTNRRLAIFIDDFHTVGLPEIEGILQRFVNYLPEGKQLIIGSRTCPRIGMQRLQMQGKGLVISAEELRFRFIETREFFKPRFNLNDEDIRELQQRTDGWPAAMQFVLLSFQKRSDRRSYSRSFSTLTPELVDYLAADVFLLQSERVREFLLRTSILSVMNGPLCDAVLQRDDSEARLENLEQGGLFLERSEQDSPWYRYHSLFREFLQRELQRLYPRQVRECHARAAAWLEAAGRFEEALLHYSAAGDGDAVARIVEPNIENLIYEERLGMVIRWVELLPGRVLEQAPSIQGPAIIAYAYQRQYAKAHEILALRRKSLDTDNPVQVNQYANLELFLLSAEDRMEEMGQIACDSLKNMPEDMAFEHGIHLNAYAYWLCATNQFEAAHSALIRARASHDVAGDLFGRAYQEGIDGTIAMAQGDLPLALERYRAGMRNAERDLPPGSSCGAFLAAHLAEVLYEVNESARARELLEDYLPLIDKNCIVDAVVCAHVTLSRIAFENHQIEEAVGQLEELLVLGHRHNWPRMVREARWQMLRLQTLSCNAEKATHVMGEIEAAGDDALSGGIDYHSGDIEPRGVARARYLISRGDYRSARTLLRGAIAHAEKTGRNRRLVKLRIVNALALDAAGEDSSARRELGKALRMGEHGGFIRSFIDEGEPLLKLLRKIHEDIRIESVSHISDNFSAYVGSLLEAAGEVPQNVDQPVSFDAPLETLTDKECEILSLLSAGKSNKAMARHLSVSDNTIKWHLRNVYEKLGVNNRTQAVSAGRKFGLIS